MEQSILVAGKEYISAIRAAKKIGYDSDYVGQLLRAKKIPGKLIGKTWYLDYDALIDYKKHRKLGKRKKAQSLEKPREIIAPVAAYSFSPTSQDENIPSDLSEIQKSEILKDFVITYESEDKSRLPELSKAAKGVAAKKPLAPSTRHLVRFSVPLALSVMVLFGVIFTKPETLSLQPVVSTYRSMSFSITSKEPALTFSYFAALWEKIFKKGDDVQLAMDAPAIPSSSASGIVVIPEPEDREGAIARIKRAFSDNVEVAFDSGGDSGIIKPVFRERDETENYAFVLVPLNDGDKTQN